MNGPKNAESLSQRLAAFATALRFDDLPAEVVDKAKAVVLHGIAVGLASHADQDVGLARSLVTEDPVSASCRLLGFGDRVSRDNAAFFDSVLIHARGQDDSYRMLTHPGSVILPVAFAESEGRGIDGKTFLTAVAAGYELQCRIARDHIPSAQNAGFRSSALFGIFGPTAAAAKLRKLDGARFAHALALAVSYASGNGETSRAGTREMVWQEPVICQAAMWAAKLAERGVSGAPLSLDGPAGFYYSFTGSATGELTGSFHDEYHADPALVGADLGNRWEILGVTMKIYSSAGFNQPVIEAIGRLAREHNLRPDDIHAMTIEMNLWETVYPSPKFPPRTNWQGTNFGSTSYFAAQALASKGYPVSGRRLAYGAADPAEEPAEVVSLIGRTRVVAGNRRQYAPKVTIETRDGRSLVAEMTGDEFKWDLATERERVKSLFPAMALSSNQAEALVDLVARLEQLDTVDSLVTATIPE